MMGRRCVDCGAGGVGCGGVKDIVGKEGFLSARE